jgi:hypothetical protein
MDNKRALQILTDAGVYLPSVVPGRGEGGFFVFSSLKELGRGDSVDAAIEDARRRGNIPPDADRPEYVAKANDIFRVRRPSSLVATATSRTMADRIANALNLYNPNERGI